MSMGSFDADTSNRWSEIVKILLILLAVALGLGFSAQAATPASISTASLNRTQDLSHRYY
jgi:hypothetical protein